MNSTCTSDCSCNCSDNDSAMLLDQELLIEVKNLSMAFQTSFHHDSVRDLFIKFMQNPLKGILRPKERLHVLQDISFSVRKGEVVGLLGINGTGKTTLCRCVADIYKPQSGTLKTRGNVRAVFDTSIGSNQELTGKENSTLLASIMFPHIKSHTKLLEDAFEFSELEHFLDMPIKTYSKGMLARLFLSLVSAVPSDILILDEVFDGADAFFQQKIANRVHEMIKASGAVLFVSHSNDQVAKICNRVLVFEKGKIAFDGDVNKGIDYYEKYSNRGMN